MLKLSVRNVVNLVDVSPEPNITRMIKIHVDTCLSVDILISLRTPSNSRRDVT
jgi:hypothetical protein